MIKPSVLFISLTFLAEFSFSQTLRVEERKVKTEESAEVSSWTAIIDQDVDFCRDSYDAFIKEFLKTKTDKRGKNVLVAVKVVIPELTNLRIDQRAIFGTETGGTSVSFTFSPGYDVHFSNDSYADEFSKAEAFTKNFVRYHYKRFYNDQLKSLQETLDSKKNEIASNEKKIDRNDKTLQGYQKSGGDATKSDNLKRENDNLNAANSKLKVEMDKIEEEIEQIKERLNKVSAFE
jgi:flagellar biosynthesis chaperone FliJ